MFTLYILRLRNSESHLLVINFCHLKFLIHFCSKMASSSSFSLPQIQSEQTSSHTQSSIFRISHRWIIDDFSHFYLTSVKCSLDSTTFSPSSNDELKFRLRLYPNGRNEHYSEYASLFLLFDYIDEKAISIKVSVSLVDGQGQMRKTQAKQCLLQSGKALSWPEFVSRSSLLNPSKGQLPNDKMTILCEVRITKIFESLLTRLLIPSLFTDKCSHQSIYHVRKGM